MKREEEKEEEEEEERMINIEEKRDERRGAEGRGMRKAHTIYAIIAKLPKDETDSLENGEDADDVTLF